MTWRVKGLHDSSICIKGQSTHLVHKRTNVMCRKTARMYGGRCDPVNDAQRRLIVPIRHTGRDITRMESDELSTGLRQLHRATLSEERLFDSRLHPGAATNMTEVREGQSTAGWRLKRPRCSSGDVAWATQPLKRFPAHIRWSSMASYNASRMQLLILIFPSLSITGVTNIFLFSLLCFDVDLRLRWIIESRQAFKQQGKPETKDPIPPIFTWCQPPDTHTH